MAHTPAQVTIKASDIKSVAWQLAALERVLQALTCSQCGLTLADRACGPTHAMLAADPARHRTIAGD